MKNLFYTFLIILSFHSCVFAQKADTSKGNKTAAVMYEDKTVKNEIGFDMFVFLSILKIYYMGEPSTIFSIGYNRELHDNIILRTTIGSGYLNNVVKSDSVPSLRTLNVLENLDIGIAWEKEAFHRCQFYFGADLEFQYGHNRQQQLTSFKNNVQVYTNNIFMTKPGPFLGLVFYINPRLSVNIESNLNFVYNLNTSKTVDAEHPELNSNQSIKGFNTTYTIPHTIFLNMKF